MTPEIVKADGSIEPFDGAKLEASLRKAGASGTTAIRIRSAIESSLTNGARTQDIYRRAFQMLRHDTRSVAARYSLRRALFEFGPTGHPFEDFVSEIFRAEGWNVEYRKLVPGRCVPHEVDVYATKDDEVLMAELKYHNDPGFKTDIKVALYVKARFDDIDHCEPKHGNKCPLHHGYLVTNTKFTGQAVDFAKCAGIELIGWTYPNEGNLYDRIMATGVYPVTTLTSLRKGEKRLLIDQGIVTTNQLKEKREALRTLGITPERVGTIMAEIESLASSVYA